MTPDAAETQLPIEWLPAHLRLHAYRAIQAETMALLVEVYKATRAGQEALISALAAEPPTAIADALDRLIEALAPLQARARAVRNLCEDRRTPRERGQARWGSLNAQDADVQDPVPRLLRKATHAARG